MKSILYAFLVLASISVSAQEMTAQQWNWYLSAFDSPSTGSGVLIRSGIAHVDLSNTDIRIKFNEKKLPELNAIYVGKFTKAGEVKGQLNGFFFHGSEEWNGSYHQANLNECHFQEIILKSDVPDGSVLVISRIQGKCQ